MRLKKLRNKVLVFVVCIMLLAFSTVAYAASGPGLSAFPSPVDTQSWKLSRDMTWDDYKPIPGADYSSVQPTRVLHGYFILADFPDRPFISSQPVGSVTDSNPQIGDIPRDQLAQFWKDYLNTPSELNHGQTIASYWKENSYGNWQVEFDAFGPYTMPGYEFQYGLGSYARSSMPIDPTTGQAYARRSLFADAPAAAIAAGVDTSKYDFGFILHAGYDQSSIWQEFGEMMFQTKDDVTAEFGPGAFGNPAINGNWAPTRYVPWSSWLASKSVWSSTSGKQSQQGESDGMGTFAHEFGHITSVGDNYNNPYGIPVSRTYTGPWELMSRGSFGGPGGPHTRWMVPNTMGGTTPSHMMIRNKIRLGFIPTTGETSQLATVSRDELANIGPQFYDIVAREVPIGDQFNIKSGLHGVDITMVDNTPKTDTKRYNLQEDWRADMQNGEKWYDNYTIEVSQQVGADSFDPDSGVLISKTKDPVSGRDRSPYTWIIDSHPEDINIVDFTRPDGTAAMLSVGDMQQLDDACFKAGTADGVVSEYEDVYNRLHFYILGKSYDDQGVLSYRVAVRNLDGAGSYNRGITVKPGEFSAAVPGRVAVYNFDVTNTGEATDLMRIASSNDSGYEQMIMNNVIEVKAGQTVTVPVYVKITKTTKGSPAPNVTFTATSETDSTKTASIYTGASNATISDLQIAGVEINGFNPERLAYNIELPAGTTEVPAVTYTLADEGKATAVVTPAVDLNGTTTIVVTSGDGKTTRTFTISFRVAKK